MFRPSLGEILLIVLVALVVFGARRLPELGKSVGEAVRNFQRAVRGEGGEKSPDKPSESPENKG